MTALTPKDIAASVRQRLTNHASRSKEDFQVVLAQYGFERLLYRLSESPHSKQFTIKGALMFLVWAGEQYRPTRDLDLAASKQHTAIELKSIFQSVCALPVAEDGLVFFQETVHAEPIREDSEYGGIRVTMEARLGRAKIPLQVDIGFGDAITPKAVIETFPAILDFPAPRLAMYPRETAIAEKYETIIRRGIINSRMKDYYDIWALAQNFDFSGEVLQHAIKATFRRRKTTLPSDVPVGLTDGFAEDKTKQTQWTAFIRRTRLKLSASSLNIVVDEIRAFLLPVSISALHSDVFHKKWHKGRGWK